MKIQNLVALVLPLLLASCSANTPEPKADTPKPTGTLNSTTEINTPAGANSGEPNLHTSASGKTYLTWIERNDSGQASVKFSMKTADGWSEPRVVAQSYNMFVNWADVPSLLELAGGVLAAHWQVSFADADEGYNVNVAISKDEGKTWSKPVTPHRDGKKGEHGFVSLSAAPGDKGVSILWLDPRKLKDEEGDVALMQTTIALDGKLGSELEVDPRVCECCQPTAIPMAGGLLAVYRDRSAEEIRDVVVSRFDGTKWSEPTTVGVDNWMILACPIQGPAISAAGENVAVAWFTAANDKPKVQVAVSKDGGKTFGPAVQVDDGNPIGRVDVVALDSGGAVVTWIENVAQAGEVRAREVGSGGEKLDARTVAKTSLGNASGFPKVERNGSEFVFAWTDSEAGKVKTAVGKP
jgi:hypothetical protein